MTWRNQIAAWAVLVAAVLLLYGWTLNGYFVADDFGYVSRFSAFPLGSWPGLFVNDWSGGIWDGVLNELRPFAALTFIIDARLWGTHAGGYHLTNLLLHVCCSGLVMLIAFSVTRAHLSALVAGLLFAVHPVQREAVIWITGRVDLLAAAGFLLGFYGYLRHREEPRAVWLAAAWCGFGFGIFAKESCLLLPVVALLHDRTLGRSAATPQRTAVAPYAGWAILAIVYIGCRVIALDGVVPPTFDVAGVWNAAGRGLRRITGYVGAMFVPRDALDVLLASVRPYSVPVTAAIVAALLCLVSAGVSVPAFRRAPAIRAAMFFGMAWPIVTTAPLVVTYFSLRHLYTASAGFVIGLVALMTWLLPNRRAFAACAALLVVSLVAGTLPGLRTWRASQDHSRRISEAIGVVAQQAAPGDVLVLDVAELHDDRWLWAWANPFALRPPFRRRDLTTRLVVLPAPGVHRDPEAWPSPRTAARLDTTRGAGWVISSDREHTVHVERFTPESMRRALDLAPLYEPDAFDRLLRELGAPDP